MNLDELRHEWQAAGNNSESEKLLHDVQQRSARFDRETSLRTLYGAASFLLPVPLAVLIFEIVPSQTALLRTVEGFMLAFLLACAGIVVALGLKRRRDRIPSLSLREYLQDQLARVERQARLFRSIKWWFWTPLLAGWALYSIALLAGAFERNLFSLLNLFLLPALAYFGIRAANRYLEREILPWQKKFAENLHDIELE